MLRDYEKIATVYPQLPPNTPALPGLEQLEHEPAVGDRDSRLDINPSHDHIPEGMHHFDDLARKITFHRVRCRRQ